MLGDNGAGLPARMLTVASRASISSESSGFHLHEGDSGGGGDLARRVETTGVICKADIETQNRQI